MNNNSESKYLKEDINIFQYTNGGLYFAQGEIKYIEDYKIKHLVSTYHSSSGSHL